MSRYTDKAEQLRSEYKENGQPLYNCAQCMLMAMSEETGSDDETMRRLGVHFGGGMKMGSVCGAFTGGLMILGLLGIEDNASRSRFVNTLKEKHNGLLNCTDLLRANAVSGVPKKVHCDGMIYDAIEIIEEIAAEKKEADNKIL